MNKTSTPWLIALDLDGTLFGDDLVILPRVREAITRAQAAGHLVTLATGRSFVATHPVAVDLGLTAPLITYQGAVIRTERELIWQQSLPYEVAREVLDFAETRGLSAHVYLPDGIFAAERTPETSYYEALHPTVTIQFVGRLTEFLSGDAIKVLLNLNPEDTDRVLRELTDRIGPRGAVVRSHPNFVEVTHPAVNKGRALLALAEHAGIAREHTLGIGDNLNDLPLIDAAAVGVAMGNAAPAVKAIADWVAPPVSEGGVAVAIERFILNAQDIL